MSEDTGNPKPIDEEQLQLFLECVELVSGSPSGCGEVITTIRDGRMVFSQPAPSLDARPSRVAANRAWLWEIRERLHRRAR